LVVVMLATEGFALSAFVYCLDHKRRMYMLQNGISQEEPLDVRLDRRLFGGLFLLLTGIALVIFPNVASSAGLEVSPTTSLMLIGILALCLFLLLTGIALVIFPNVASSAGLEVSPTTSLMLIGILALSAGLATILGYCILKRGLSSLADRGRKL